MVVGRMVVVFMARCMADMVHRTNLVHLILILFLLLLFKLVIIVVWS